MSIKRWAIADTVTKEISGGIVQNNIAPAAASGDIVFEVPDALRDEHPEKLRVDSAGIGIERKPIADILAQKKAEREKEITLELYQEAQEQLPMPVLLRAITTILGVLVNSGSISNSDPDTASLLNTLTLHSTQLGFTPAQAKQVLLLQKSLMDRKGTAVTEIDAIISDPIKTEDEKEKDIEKVRG